MSPQLKKTLKEQISDFAYKEGLLSLSTGDKNLISISVDDLDERTKLSEKLVELENSLIKPISLLKNNKFPFYDLSLIHI